MARGDPRAPRSCWAGACQGILGGLLERYAWRKTSAAGGGLRDSPPPGYASRAAAGRAGAPEKKATRFWGNTQGPGGGAQIPSALGGKGEVSRAGNGWESSPKAWQRGRFCRGGGGAFSFYLLPLGSPGACCLQGNSTGAPRPAGDTLSPSPLPAARAPHGPVRGEGAELAGRAPRGAHGATSPPCPALGASPPGSLSRAMPFSLRPRDGSSLPRLLLGTHGHAWGFPEPFFFGAGLRPGGVGRRKPLAGLRSRGSRAPFLAYGWAGKCFTLM